MINHQLNVTIYMVISGYTPAETYLQSEIKMQYYRL